MSKETYIYIHTSMMYVYMCICMRLVHIKRDLENAQSATHCIAAASRRDDGAETQRCMHRISVYIKRDLYIYTYIFDIYIYTYVYDICVYV